MTRQLILPATAADTFAIGGDRTVNRMGYGAMRITGSEVCGPPPDKQAAFATLRKANVLSGVVLRATILRGFGLRSGKP